MQYAARAAANCLYVCLVLMFFFLLQFAFFFLTGPVVGESGDLSNSSRFLTASKRVTARGGACQSHRRIRGNVLLVRGFDSEERVTA